jgi:hypothetical protein
VLKRLTLSDDELEFDLEWPSRFKLNNRNLGLDFGFTELVVDVID